MDPNKQIRCPRCCQICQGYGKFMDHLERHKDGSWNGWNLDMSVALVQARPPGTLPPQTLNLYPAPPSVSAHTSSVNCASIFKETANQKEEASTSLRLGYRPE
ncbi:hypothetical protein CTI12_AA323170 [Artemisia annua]|uniref:Uncharacterized protein n=1 Tax=Artemisia annua TaxID=35608 RepID=A0A2U1N0A4_ARTAN|nr:hypothetical protein CTI12_AA323170 [Artemisia annua]